MARRETRVPAGDKALVLVSDMLQNSAQFTVFGTNAAAREPSGCAGWSRRSGGIRTARLGA